MTEHSGLIDSLVTDLPAVKPVRRIHARACAWLVLTLLVVAVGGLASGPLRPGLGAQLLGSPQFLIESLLGIAGAVMAGIAAFRAAVPGALDRRFATATLLVVGGWAVCFAIGLVHPALEPSMLGKRALCVWETPLLALLPLLAGIAWQRRLYPLSPGYAGMLPGLAAGVLAAVFMQFACMYEPVHVLSFHMLPGLAVALAGGALAVLYARLRRSRSIAAAR